MDARWNSLESSSRNESENYNSVSSIALFTTLICVCIVVGHLIERFKWINESVTAILIGLFTGFSVLVYKRGESSKVLQFDENLFFVYLLPPIIFNAGFQVKKKSFFVNFFAIMAYGVLGIFISFGVISSGLWFFYRLIGLNLLTIKDILALGTIFSATDSVCTLQILDQDKHALLYSLVFGEGVVNDATSVALFRAVQKFSYGDFSALTVLKFVFSFLYLFLFSTVLGISVGLLSAFILNQLYLEHSTDREVSLMIVMAYLSYVLSELLGWSGILTVFFCGVVMSHYTWHNVTESSRVTSKHSFASMSFISETFIFIYVGMDCLEIENWKKTFFKEGSILFCVLLLLTLLGRAAFVFPLSYLMNRRRKSSKKISFNEQIIIWWAGLMRGAVSIALTFNSFSHFELNSDYPTIISSTLSFVLFSTIVIGLLTRPLIDFLLPQTNETQIFNRVDSLLASEVDSSIPDLLRIPLLSHEDKKQDANTNTDSMTFPDRPVTLISDPHFPQPFSSVTIPPSNERKELQMESELLSTTEDAEPPISNSVFSDPEFSQSLNSSQMDILPLAVISEPSLSQGGPASHHATTRLNSGPSAHARMRRIQSLVRDEGIQVILNAEEKDIHQLWRWFDKSYMRPYFGGKALMDDSHPPSEKDQTGIRSHSLALEFSKSSNVTEVCLPASSQKPSKSLYIDKKPSRKKFFPSVSEIIECEGEEEGEEVRGYGLADGERAFPENISQLSDKEKQIEKRFFGLANSESAWPIAERRNTGNHRLPRDSNDYGGKNEDDGGL